MMMIEIMQTLQSCCNLNEQTPDFSLGDVFPLLSVSGYKITKGPLFRILHHKIKILSISEGAVVFHHKGRDDSSLNRSFLKSTDYLFPRDKGGIQSTARNK